MQRLETQIKLLADDIEAFKEKPQEDWRADDVSSLAKHCKSVIEDFQDIIKNLNWTGTQELTESSEVIDQVKLMNEKINKIKSETLIAIKNRENLIKNNKIEKNEKK